MISSVKTQLSGQLPLKLVDKLIDCYIELKQNYYLGRHRPSELEGGRFVELVRRILEYHTTGSYTPLNQALRGFNETALQTFERLDGKRFCDSLRKHIPRVLKAIYNIRNNRDVGHVGGDVSPNYMDSTLISTACDWILAELLRIFHDMPLDRAQRIIDSLVKRKIPLVYEIDGFYKVLNPDLVLKDKILAILYVRGDAGATDDQLISWLDYDNRSYLTSKVLSPLKKRTFIHRAANKNKITPLGTVYVEKHIRFDLQI